MRRHRQRSSIFSGRRGAILAIIVLAGLAALAAALDPAPPPVAGLARASDGDSFRLGEERIRLLGLDAPELAQTCIDATDRVWSCGRVARDRMAALLAAGPAACRPEDHDQFGRLLATCTIAGHDPAATLVKEGLALSTGRYGNEEAAARRDKIGIWSGNFDSPRNWRDSHARPPGNWNLLSILGL